jgi:CyaY protein
MARAAEFNFWYRSLEMDDDTFDRIADTELQVLERALGALDPDEVEVELASGVLTLTFADDQQVVINSHRAAREIWMAAFRQAWHFQPKEEGGRWVWRTAADELRATIRKVIGGRLGRSIEI